MNNETIEQMKDIGAAYETAEEEGKRLVARYKESEAFAKELYEKNKAKGRPDHIPDSDKDLIMEIVGNHIVWRKMTQKDRDDRNRRLVMMAGMMPMPMTVDSLFDQA